jgi:hypothetical protein
MSPLNQLLMEYPPEDKDLLGLAAIAYLKRSSEFFGT